MRPHSWIAGSWNNDLRLIPWLLALLLAVLAIDATAAETARVGVRTGEHDDRSRIVFDWTGPVGVKIEQPAAGELIVLFDKPADFDLSKARVDKLSRVASIEPVADRPALRITLRGAHGYKLTDSDFKIVVDIIDDAAGTPSAERTISKKTTKKNKQEPASYSQSNPAASTAQDAAASPNKDDAFSQRPHQQGHPRPPAPRPADWADPNPLLDPAAWRGSN